MATAGQAGAVTLDVAGFNRQMESLKRDYGVKMNTSIHNEHRLWIRDLIKLTYPRKMGEGKRAVENDLKRAFVGVPRVRWESGALVNKGLESYTMKSFHKHARGMRSGRVAKSYGKNGSSQRMLVPLKMLREYTREVQKGVGKLKAGWLASAKGMDLRLPKWVSPVTAHRGSHVDAVDRRTGTGSITSINNVPYASRKIGKLLQITAAGRSRSFATRVQRAQESAIRKSNARTR